MKKQQQQLYLKIPILCVMISDISAIAKKYRVMASHLDERARRMWAATEADSLGYGGVPAVSKAAGISRRVIHVGLSELRQGDPLPAERIRRPGGGRKSSVHHYPALPKELEKLVEPLTRGDPCAGSSSALASFASAPSGFNPNRIWGGGFGAWTDQDNRNNLTGYEYKSGGFILGYDREIGESLVVGLSGAYSTGEIENNDGYTTTDGRSQQRA